MRVRDDVPFAERGQKIVDTKNAVEITLLRRGAIASLRIRAIESDILGRFD
jgi:hypothetical protein